MLSRVLAVLVLCSFLAGGSLLAWRGRAPQTQRPVPALCAPSASAPGGSAAPAPSATREELPWVNRDVLPGLLQLESQLVLGRPVSQLRVSDDGTHIAAHGFDSTLWILRREGASLALERTMQGVALFAIDPSGTALATIDDENRLRLWTLPATGEPESRVVAEDAQDPSFRDGRLHWSDTRERAFRLDERGEVRAAPARAEEAAELVANGIHDWLPDTYGFVRTSARAGTLSFAGTSNGTMVVVDAEHDALITAARMQRGDINELATRGPWLFSTGVDGALRLWRVDLENAPSATRVVSGSDRDRCRSSCILAAWDDVATNRQVVTLRGGAGTRLFTPQRPEGVRIGAVVGTPFLPNGTVSVQPTRSRLLFHTDDGALESSVGLEGITSFLDIEVGAAGRQVLVSGYWPTVVVDRTNPRAPTVHRVEGSSRRIEASPSGAWFAATTNDGHVRAWRPGHEDVARTQPLDATQLEFDAADSVLVFGTEGQAHAWHLASDRVVALDQPPGGQMQDLRTSRDGTRALGMFTDGATVLWDTHTGRIVRRFWCMGDHDDSARYSELSPDKTLLLSHTYAGSLALCSVATGAALARWATASLAAQQPGFSADGSSVHWFSEHGRVTWPLRGLAR